MNDTLRISCLAVVMMACFLSWQACEEATEWQLHTGNNGRLVVEAILTDEFTTQIITLSKSFDNLAGVAPPVTDATVYVEVNGARFPFQAHPLNPGCYVSEKPFMVLNNLYYNLHIIWLGKEYKAASELSEVAPLPAIRFSRFQDTDSLYFADFPAEFLYNPNQQAMYEMNIDWSHLSHVEPRKAKMLFYTFNSLHVSELIRPGRDTVLFPQGSLVMVKKYGLNDDFAAYLRALAIETDWNSGAFLFSNPSSLPTNISPDGLGFFSTCAVVKDTLIAR